MKRKAFPGKQGKMRFQKAKKSKALFSFVFIALFLFVMGCGEQTPPPSPAVKGKLSTVDKKKVEPAKVDEKKEEEKKEEVEYSYNPSGKADPFKPFIQLTLVKESQRGVPLTPLQKYEISQLKLVAIISSPEGNIALIEDSSGKGYFLKKGTLIGKNDGKVTRILKDKVIVEEVFEDVMGKKKVNEISLFLHRVEEGGES